MNVDYVIIGHSERREMFAETDETVNKKVHAAFERGLTTLAAVARMMPADSKNRDVVFVPARGGLGEKVENQANTISAEFATRAHAQYRLLHVPDQLGD